MYVHHDRHGDPRNYSFLISYLFPLTAEQFEQDDDPEAGLDEPSITTHKYGGAQSSTSAQIILFVTHWHLLIIIL
jgi:hypothetical protein